MAMVTITIEGATRARYDGGVLMVLCSSKGRYDRMVMRIDGNTYDLRVVEDVTPTGLNFVVIDSGVCVSLTEENRLELFSARRGATGVRVVEDKMLTGSMRLHKRAGRVAVTNGSKLYSLALR